MTLALSPSSRLEMPWKLQTHLKKLIVTPRKQLSLPPSFLEPDDLFLEEQALPAEIILLIFEFAYPPSEAPSTRPLPRSHIEGLLAFSLLSHAWRNWAQPQLYVFPFLHLAPTVSLFVSTVKRNPALAGSVRRVHLLGRKHGARWKVTGRMRSLWKACEGVETLIIEDADEVSVDNLVGCKRLTHLLLLSSQIIPSTTSRLPNFPSITHLTLSSITFHTTSHRSLLSPTTFPSLTHLSLSDSVLGNAGLLGYRIKPFPGLPNSASTSGSFLPTIQVLAIGRHLDGDAELDLSTCESLKAISIGRCCPAKKVLGTLREPGVEVLRVEEGPEGGGREGKARVKELRDDVVAMLELGIPVVKGLKELVVPVGWMEDERLRGLCEAKGVRMRVDDVGDDALTRARFWGLGGLDKTSGRRPAYKHFDGKAPGPAIHDSAFWELVSVDVPRVINGESGRKRWTKLTGGKYQAPIWYAAAEYKSQRVGREPRADNKALGDGMDAGRGGRDSGYESDKSKTQEKKVLQSLKRGTKPPRIVEEWESDDDEVVVIVESSKKNRVIKPEALVERNRLPPSMDAPSPKPAKVDERPSLFASITGVMKLAEGGDAATLRAAEQFAEKLAAGWGSRGTK